MKIIYLVIKDNDDTLMLETITGQHTMRMRARATRRSNNKFHTDSRTFTLWWCVFVGVTHNNN